MEESTQKLKNILSFKKLFRGAGPKSFHLPIFNLAITTSANQPIKVGMFKVVAAQNVARLACKKESARAGAEGMATTANPRAGRSLIVPQRQSQFR